MARRMPPKKKPRTPPPPRGIQARANKGRPVQAPQVRAGSRGGDMGDRHRKILYGLAGAGVLGLVAVVLLFALGGGKSNNEKVANLMTQAGCTLKTVKASVPNGVTHVASLT